ncbi:MAG: hypothetical protein CVT92_08905 [Bacteroidetes bacterium HGW-Bacteroidetes-1]|jgi:hypothetical protein|nr:MAG: hypothetical protein CVT92_08905 [Bacteroidetes bacterium HGW-Bacteroidetes-1]
MPKVTLFINKLHASKFHFGALILLFVMILSLPNQIHAQFYNGSSMSFGKNRVQWNNTIWSYYRFDQFDTYFYLNGKELALYTARYADEQIPVLERRLQAALSEKIQFIVFNNLGDLKQSNIGLASEQQYNTGGITHIIGSKVFIYFDGNYLHFEQQIRAGIAEILINQLMFGGSIGTQIRNTALFKLPEWYKKGLLSYISEEWNTELDSRMREGIGEKRFKKINRLEGEEALIAGHSYWRFIETTYGPSAIPDIVHMTQVSRNVQNGFLYVTGVKFKQLIKDWYLFYEQHYSDFEPIKPSHPLTLKYRTYRTFNRPDFSPDERYLSYTTSDEGLLKLWLLDLKTGKKKRMFKAGFSTDEKIDASFPPTAWHPSGEIFAFILEEKGKIFLYFYNLNDGSIESRNMFDFQKITHFSYSGDGRQLAMAAVKQGKPDIYVFDLASNSNIQITNDYHTDLHPVFVNGNKTIIFSSNRPTDTIKTQDKPEGQLPTFDLFSYDYSRRNPILRRLTETPLVNEKRPLQDKKDVIHYLSDASGYYNLYIGRFDSVIAYVDTTVHYRYFMESMQQTNFSTNLLDYTSSPLSDNIYIVARNDNRQKLFQIQKKELISNQFQSERTSLFMQQQIDKLKQSTQEQAADIQQRKRFRSLFRPAVISDTLLQAPLPSRQGAFGISGSQRLELLNQGKTSLIQDEIKGPKRRNYFVEYFYDNLITQVDFTYINYNYQPFSGGGSPIYLNPGFNVFMGVNLIDLLEDYRISGGVRLNTDLANNEYALSFSNLKKRLDRHIILHRQSIEDFGTTAYTRTHSHQAFYMLSWPFSEILAVKGTAIYRNDMKVFLATDQINLKKPNIYENWGGLRGELVFDNSRQIGMNLLIGMRWKLFGEYYQLIDPKSKNFVVLGVDLRHYQRIHRNFIWANRFAASTSFGNSKLIYYMGGVDNWLLPKFDQQTPIDFEQNYAYQTLATNMRGFNQNIRNGNSFVVANSELRFPVFSYLFQNPISSDFIRNFQLVAFGDIGTAWTGWNPYDPSNSLYTNYIYNGPLTISVEVQKDPLVGGIGGGARTTLLGYFVRADIAWGIEDAKITKPVFYISFSLDF